MGRTALVLLVTLSAVSLGAQNPSTPHSGTNHVRVDMYATRDGNPVHDLQVSDVELLEDGVPQAIETFEHVRVGTPGSSRARPPCGCRSSSSSIA